MCYNFFDIINMHSMMREKNDMRKQMITLAMTMLLGSTSVFGGTTSVQAASIQDDMSYCEIAQEVSENVSDSARGIFSVYYQVIVDNTAIKENAKSSSKTIGTAYKGSKYKKVGESGNWIKICYGSGYGYIIKSALKKL